MWGGGIVKAQKIQAAMKKSCGSRFAAARLLAHHTKTSDVEPFSLGTLQSEIEQIVTLSTVSSPRSSLRTQRLEPKWPHRTRLDHSSEVAQVRREPLQSGHGQFSRRVARCRTTLLGHDAFGRKDTLTTPKSTATFSREWLLNTAPGELVLEA